MVGRRMEIGKSFFFFPSSLCFPSNCESHSFAQLRGREENEIEGKMAATEKEEQKRPKQSKSFWCSCECVCVSVCVSVCDVVGRIPKLGWLVLHICLLRVLLL